MRRVAASMVEGREFDESSRMFILVIGCRGRMDGERVGCTGMSGICHTRCMA